MYHIMVVDDEQLTRVFLEKIIPTLHDGWTVIAEASDGKEACELLTCKNIDLVITDIKMPVMDGLALSKHIYLNYPKIPIIILSGYSEFNYAQQAIAYNVSDYLLKPIINKKLQQTLTEIYNTLEQRQKEQISHNKLLNFSSKYKDEIISQLLHAIISHSHVQVKTFLPISYELKLNLIEEEAIVCILQLTNNSLSQLNNYQNNELTKLLIYKTAIDITKNSSNRVFIDCHNDTILFIPLDQITDYKLTIKRIFDSINDAFRQGTTMTMVCFVGTKECEILQLASSYSHAKKAIYQSMLAPSTSSIIYYEANKYTDLINELHTDILSLGYALQNHDIINIKLMKDNLFAFEKEHIQTNARNLFYANILAELCHSLNIDEVSIKGYENLKIGLKNIENYLNNTFIEDLPENQIISTAKQYILDHYQEPISLSMIADYLSISPSYLSNLFHESVGQSYIKYLTKVRMKQASLLLKSNKHFTLEQIAKEVGYISVKHFSFVFKKHFHITPGEYRKNQFRGCTKL